MSDETQTEKAPTHAEIMAEVEKHNQEVENSKKNESSTVQVGNTEITSVKFSDQYTERANDYFVESAIKAARKDTQVIRINGKEHLFDYHAINHGEKLEITKVEQRRANSIVDMAQYILFKKKGLEVESYAEVDMEYKYIQARMFLRDHETGQPMTREQFNGTEPEQMNPILEGYGIRTEKPLPPPFEAKRTVK